MGSVSAMASIERVLAAHRDELITEEQIAASGTVLKYLGASIEGKLYEAVITHTFLNPKTGRKFYVTGRTFDIDELGERFPDCEVGY
jgi:hypothetical protein